MSQNPQLDANISKLRSLGIADEKIINEAMAAGWTGADIAASYASMGLPPPNIQAMAAPKSSSKGSLGKIIAVVAILIILIGGGVYAYAKGMLNFFSKPPYAQNNLITGILQKFGEVKSSSYTLSAYLKVEPREAGAEPFDIKITGDLPLKEKYMRDYTRAQDLSRIINILPTYSGTGSSRKVTYAKSLDAAAKTSSQTKSYLGDISVTDPLTNEPYSYSVSPDGSNFKLTMTFETADAIKAINAVSKYPRGLATTTVATTTIVMGNTATFTKDSYSYLYLSPKPPQSYFETLGQMSQMAPPEMDIQGSVSAASNFVSESGAAEWKFNLAGSGDLGDLTYKIDVDALKKGPDYYLKINNIPALFGGMGLAKGQWYKISPKEKSTSTVDSYDDLSDNGYSEMLASGEKSYGEQKKKIVDLMQNVAKIADEQGLIKLKGEPKKEKIGDRGVYRYDFDINKEAMVPFYEKLSEYTAKTGSNSGLATLLADPGTLNYLKSKQFSDIFDYYVKNTTTTLWVDDKGFLAAIEYSIRIVPPAEAVNLKDKQVRLKIRASFDNINEVINIETPSGAKDIEQAMKENGALSSAREKGTAASIMANLANMRAQAELVYSTSNDSYGKKAFPLGPCKNTPDTLFGDKAMYKLISDVNRIASSTATCVSQSKNGSVQSWAVSSVLPNSDYSYCVDSTGNASEILGKLKKASCR